MSRFFYPLEGDPSAYYIAGNSFKHNLMQLIARYVKDKNKQKDFFTILTTHRFIRFDELESYLESEIKREREQGNKILSILRDKLEKNILKLNTPNNVFGASLINSAKLGKGHSIQFLVIDSFTLLLKVERHPYGGKENVYQYYIFDDKVNTLSLLDFHYLSQNIKGGEVTPQSEVLKKEYENLLKKLLGHKAVKVFRKLLQHLQYQKSILIELIPDELNNEIERKLKINLIEARRATFDSKRKEFLLKNPNYVEPNDGIAVSFDGFEVLMSRNRTVKHGRYPKAKEDQSE